MNVVKIHIQLYADMALLYLHKTPQHNIQVFFTLIL